MNFVVLNTTCGRVTININNIVSFYVVSLEEGKHTTFINTTLHGYQLAVEKDISKELVMAIRSNEGTVNVIS